MTIQKARTQAFRAQKGRCFYCQAPMWNGEGEDFLREYKLPMGLAKQLQCTAEHLIARKEGGSNCLKNIAAACVTCNKRRHQRKADLSPLEYKQLVVKRLVKGAWHDYAIRMLTPIGNPSTLSHGRP